MQEEVCEELIAEAEHFAQTLGGDLYEVMKKAPQVVEKWKRHYFLAQEIWQHARSREDLRAFLLSSPDPSPAEREVWLHFMRTVPQLLRQGLQSAVKNLPPPPGGRPRELTPMECQEICAAIGRLYGQGVGLLDAQKRMAQRYNKVCAPFSEPGNSEPSGSPMPCESNNAKSQSGIFEDIKTNVRTNMSLISGKNEDS